MTQLSVAQRALIQQRLRRRTGAATIPSRTAGTAPPLSYAQERLWFLEQLAPGTAAYTIPLAVRLRGPLDLPALRSALRVLAARHEPLRTRFPSTEDGRPMVAVADGVEIPLRVVSAPECEAVALVEAAMAEPFDLAAGPPARALLVRLAGDDHVLALPVHHIASDGWSTDVLLRELLAAYHAEPLPDLPVAYGDYAAWQRTTGTDDRDLAYWRERLAGLELLELPTDRPRPAVQTHAGADHFFGVDTATTRALTELARDHGATLYMVLLAAFQAVLGRHSGQDDFAVGSPVAGRTRPEVEGLIGCFVNTLAMRADLSGDPSFVELLLRVRDTALDAYAHQGLPFERLVQELDVVRDTARSPLFEVLFAMQNFSAAGAAGAGELRVEPFPRRFRATRFPLELYVTERPDGLGGLFVYNTDLFAPETIERVAADLCALLAAVVALPDARLSTVDILAPAERDLVVDRFNDTAADFPDTATLHGLVAGQAARTPDATALVFEGGRLTYRELDTRAGQLARRLRDLGTGPGTYVAACADRSLELVVGLLGVLKAGAAYVPLDPEYPAERLAFMLADSGAPVLLTQRHLRHQLPAGPHVLLLDDAGPGTADAGPGTAADLGTAAGLSTAAGTPEPDPGTADDIAYAIYTSGSTGRPKGVPNTHRGVVNRLDWMQKRYRLGPDDVVLQKTPASFDVSVWEFFWPLIAGARLVLARPGGHKDAAYLRDVIAAHGVTTVHFVPSMLAVFLSEDGVGACRSLRRVICSGEELPVDLARRCLDTLPGELHNLYGPTEAAIDVTAWHCTPAALDGLARVPIGGPIQNIRLYVLDRARRPVPVGVPGELHIGGAGVAAGYLNRPELTADRFVPDPFRPGRLYRTGDLVRWRPDGTLDFLGRMDNQVKMRGLRIEPGEIEAALREQPGVLDAAVVVREDSPGDKRITGYVTGAADVDLRAALKRRLPDYLVPAAVVQLDVLPLSPNGKLDRRALPPPPRGRDAGAAFAAPSTATERTVAAIWSEVLRLDTVGVDDDFFDLGGHSLLATQVVARLRAACAAGVSVLDVFRHRTIRDLAALIDVPAAERGPRRLLNELTTGRTGAAALTFVCVPFGGGSAVVYQPLADALPADHRLFALSIPGNDVGVAEEPLPFDELAARCVSEILDRVTGPLALYGHCAVGSALVLEVTRRLEAAGRRVEAVYVGAIFPFARPPSRVWRRLSRIARMESLRADQSYANWLTSIGLELGDLDPAQTRQIIRNMRKDSDTAEEYFTRLFESDPVRLRAPVISVVGERDAATDLYQERYREWHFVTGTTALVVLDEAGHFFLKYRAGEVAAIVTRAHRALDDPVKPRDPQGGWELREVSRSATVVPAGQSGPQPSLRRFLAVAAGQLVSMTGTALTDFALPLWVYLRTGSLLNFALLAVAGLVPGMLAAPLAGAIVDRYSRRRVMLAGDGVAGGTLLLLGVLLWSGQLRTWQLYPLIMVLSVALVFQRLAYASAVAQLVPKRYLGHANGVVQMIGGVTQILVPLLAVGLLAFAGLGGILLLDVASYVVAVAVLLAVRFPGTLAWRRKESLSAEIVGGFRYSWGNRHFRAMLLFFAGLNIFLSPLFLMISPLVLSFATLSEVGRVAVAGGAGALVGGLAMTVWGGPRRLRMRGVLLGTLALAAACAVTGLRPALWLVALGAAGMSLALTLVNGVYATIVQVKVPQRFHGRVFALNTVIAWSTLPIGWALVAPNAARILDPLVAAGGPLADSVGRLIGTGPGRGIGLMYLLFALAMAGYALASLRVRTLARFDAEVPDAEPDDLVGVKARRRRSGR